MSVSRNVSGGNQSETPVDLPLVAPAPPMASAKGNPMQALANHAWQNRIKGRSLARSSLLMPWTMLVEAIEQHPTPSERELVRASQIEEIFARLHRIAEQRFKPGRTKREAVEAYVDLFFDGVVDQLCRGDANRLLQQERFLRSAYLFYVREAIPVPEREEALTEEDAD